jgi:hypothetical protein
MATRRGQTPKFILGKKTSIQFIREQESAIYRESKATGEWGMIEYENIELFHQQLNLRGIKEHKLYEKILYYKQLGYIKTKREQSDLMT